MRPNRTLWSVALAATTATLLASAPARAEYAVPPETLLLSLIHI